ncbi:hypothetical protein AB0J14_04720 [Micromonospora arborensis]|uniref:hypothetical protein n=1 Tax=Micromonospora arborensis TaxID=2116518 RepID=UPI003403D1DA
MAETTAAPPIVGTTDDEFDSIIEDANLPVLLVRLCLDGKLRREYEDVKTRITGRAAERDSARTVSAAAALNEGDTRLASKGPTVPADDEPDPEQAHLDELVERMRTKLMTFVVQAVSSKEYNRILEGNPPRKDPATGRIDQRDYQGYNSATFPAALVRASIAKPTMTDARWAKLDAALTDAQFDKLFQASAEVNRRDEDIPF